MAKKKVRIAELKAHLSAYLKRAAKGERITVYDRDTPVAELGPAQAAEIDALGTLAADGHVRMGSQSFASLTFSKSASPIDAQALLQSVRGD